MSPFFADLIALIHAGFIAFVVVGQLLIIIGLIARWRWVRNFFFRAIHLACILYVVAEAWLGVECPLTRWEYILRRAADPGLQTRGFIGIWVDRLCFFSGPTWVFTLAYTLFGAAVLMTFIVGPPRWPRRRAR
jgi:hypothetical protein